MSIKSHSNHIRLKFCKKIKKMLFKRGATISNSENAKTIIKVVKGIGSN